MARARDLGDQFPSDTNDVLPPDILADRMLVDYLVYTDPDTSPGSGGKGSFTNRPRTLGRHARSSTGGERDNDFDYVEIDFRKTPVKDSTQPNDPDRESTFASVFDTRLKRLYIRTLAKFGGAVSPDLDPELDYKSGPVKWYFDPDSKPFINAPIPGIFRTDAFFPIVLTVVDGDLGSATSAPTLRYQIESLTGEILRDSFNQPLTPVRPRTIGKIKNPVTGTIGSAGILPNGAIFLYDAGEVPDNAVCEDP